MERDIYHGYSCWRKDVCGQAEASRWKKGIDVRMRSFNGYTIIPLRFHRSTPWSRNISTITSPGGFPHSPTAVAKPKSVATKTRV
jgi:hypothetical protein